MCSDCDLPAEGAVVSNVLHIVEYLDGDGSIKWVDFSHSSDGDVLGTGKRFELCERARSVELAAMAFELLHDYCGVECE